MLRGHSRDVQQPVFSPDGKTLYTASHDGTVIAWDVSGGKDSGLARPFMFTHDRGVRPSGTTGTREAFSPDGRLIAVGLKDQGIALWDARDAPRPVGTPLLGTGGEVKALAFFDGRANARCSCHHRLGDGVGRGDRDRCARGRLPFRLWTTLGVSISQDGTSARDCRATPVSTFWDVADRVPGRCDRSRELRGRRCRLQRRPEPARRVRARSRPYPRRSGTAFRALADRAEKDAGSRGSRIRTISSGGPSPSVPTAACSRPAWPQPARARVGRATGTGKLIREIEQNVGSTVLWRSSSGRMAGLSPSRASRPSHRFGMSEPGPRSARGSPPASQDDDRPLRRRTPAVDDARQRPGGSLGRRPESWEPRLRPSEPHADARGVGGVSPRAAVRAGLCELRSSQGRIDQVKRVSAAGGASPPGRRPRRTSSVGGGPLWRA